MNDWLSDALLDFLGAPPDGTEKELILDGSQNTELGGTASSDFIISGDGNDVLSGFDGDDFLFGGSGLDELNGGAGDDELFGGEDSDILTGGEDDDKFYASADDVIRDPEQGDEIWADLYPNDDVEEYEELGEGYIVEQLGEDAIPTEGWLFRGAFGEEYWLGDQEDPGPDLEIRLPGGGVVLVEDWIDEWPPEASSYTNSGVTLYLEPRPAVAGFQDLILELKFAAAFRLLDSTNDKPGGGIGGGGSSSDDSGGNGGNGGPGPVEPPGPPPPPPADIDNVHRIHIDHDNIEDAAEAARQSLAGEGVNAPRDVLEKYGLEEYLREHWDNGGWDRYEGADGLQNLIDDILDRWFDEHGEEEELPPLPEWLEDALDDFDDAYDIISPLVMDLDGDGVELVALEESTAFFDLDSDNFAERTGWVEPDDGLLAMDRDGDGRIGDISELFGNATTDGFSELSELDSNDDGVIDVNDEQFADLLIWVDANQDGYSQESELRSLSDAGIESIDLGASQTNLWDAGNHISHVGSFAWSDGRVGEISDVWFANSQVHTIYELNVDAEITIEHLLLPGLRGYGTLPALTVAMSEDSVLQGAVTELALADLSNGHTFHTQVEGILSRWAKADLVAPGSRGINVDAQHLAVLEALFGQSYEQYGGPNPRGNAGAELERIYDYVRDEISARLLVQGPLLELTLDLRYDSGRDEFSGDIDYGVLIAALEPTAPTDALERARYWDVMVTTLNTLGNYVAPPGNYDQLFNASIAATGDAFTVADLRAGNVDFVNGNDFFQDGADSRTYSFGTGSGKDRILDDDPTETGLDVVEFSSELAPGDVELSRGGSTSDNLIIRIAGTADELKIIDQFKSGQYGIEELRFADGTVWTAEDVVDMLMTGTEGNDDLIGDGRDNDLGGDAGDDYLEGRGGSDTYIFGSGSGNDWIADNDAGASGVDVIEFTGGLSSENINLSRAGSNLVDLVVEIADTGERLTVQGMYGGVADHIEEIRFEDGTVWDRTFLEEMWLHGSAGDDTLVGTVGADSLDGAEGNDELKGIDGDDILGGGTGDDTLKGGKGLDHLAGGLGDDRLEGGWHGDSYVYDVGDGDDVIHEYSSSTSFGRHLGDKLILGAGIAPGDVTVTRDASDWGDVTLTFAGIAGSIFIDEQYNGTAYGVEEIQFDDGTVWTSRDLAHVGYGQSATASGETIFGTLMADTILGLAGDDTLQGWQGADTLTGGLGDDRLEGGWHGDSYVYDVGDGDDVIHEYSSSTSFGRHLGDKLVLGAGIAPGDVIVTRNASDWDDVTLTFTGIAGSIFIDEQFGSSAYGLEEIHFDDGTVWNETDLAVAGFSQSTTEDDDLVVGTPSNDTIDALGGNDTIKGSNGADTLTGGLGDDRLEGGWHGDSYVYDVGDGDDVIYEYASSTSFGRHLGDKLVLGAGIAPGDVTVTRDASDWGDVTLTFTGIAGSIFIDEQYNGTAYGVEEIQFDDGTVWTSRDLAHVGYGQSATASGETIFGTLMADTILGLAGDDTLQGWQGADTLTGGLGDDRLEGDWHGDSYVYDVGDGDDVIYEYASSTSFGRHLGDKLVLGAGIAPGDVTVTRDASDWGDVTLTFTGIAGSIFIDEQYNGTAYGVEEIQFDDGTVWTSRDLAHVGYGQAATASGETIFGTLMADTILGLAGDDTLQGWQGADTLTGGLGDDRLEGGWHGDSYVYDVGDGDDVIHEYSSSTSFGRHLGDKLVLGAGIAPGDVTVTRNASDWDDVTLTFTGIAGSIFIDEQFGSSAYGLEEIHFDDGTVWNETDLAELGFTQVATDSDDFIVGTPNGDAIDGLGGNDTIKGSNGADYLTGGMGDDRLEGGWHGDSYVYDVGDGDDVIYEYASSTSFGRHLGDKLVLGAGIAPGDVIVTRDASDWGDVTLTFAGIAGSIFIDEQYNGTAYGVEEIQFDDGTVWTSRDLAHVGYGQAATASGETIFGTLMADTILGLAGDDTLQGWQGADTLTGGLGDDRLEGGWHGDSYVYDVGDGDDVIYEYASSTSFGRHLGDKLVLGAGIAPGDVTVTRDASDWGDVTLTFTGIAGSIFIDEQYNGTAYGVEEIQFDDGTVWTSRDLAHVGYGQSATASGETIFGTLMADTILGLAGDDTLQGWQGADTLTGGLGDDRLEGDWHGDSYVYDVGDGDDVIYEYASSTSFGRHLGDKLVLGAGIAPGDVTVTRDASDWGDVTLTFTGIAGSIFIDEQYNGTAYGVEEIQFDDGTVWTSRDLAHVGYGQAATASGETIFGTLMADTILGLAGDDTLQGWQGADTLTGGLGDDRLEGGWHGDSYVYDVGDGDDVIYEYASSTSFGRHLGDKLVLGAGIAPGDVTVTRDASDWGDVTLTFTGIAGSIFIDEQYNGTAYGVEEIQFDDGTVWTSRDLAHVGYGQAATASGETIFGTLMADTILGLAGDDTLQGWQGADTLTGGLGDDRLEGGWHGDSYVYDVGDGDDVIYEYASSTSFGRHLGDKLVLGAGIAPGDVIVTRDASDWGDVTLTFAGIAGSIFIDEQYRGDAYGVEEIHFDDGTVWTSRDLAHVGYGQVATASGETIFGTLMADTIDGLDGDDTLYGWNGSDTLTGGLGDDRLEGGWHGDTYVYDVGDGDDVIHEYSSSTSFSRHLADKLVLGAGIAPGDVIVTRDTSDLDDATLTFAGIAGSIFIDEQFGSSAYGLEEIHFEDGTVWKEADLAAAADPNDPPVANDIAISGVQEDGAAQSFNYDASDADPDDTLTYSILTQPTEGSASDNGDGTFSFDPGSDFQDLAGGETRQVSFTYQADDGNGGTGSGTVTITVSGANDAPVASDVSYSGPAEGGMAQSFAYSGTDTDTTDTLTYSVLTQPAEGSVSDNGDGTFSFDPGSDFQDLAGGETREVSFTYQADDGNGGTDSGTVTVTVSGTNDAPVASDVSYSGPVENGSAQSFAYSGADADTSDTLTYSILTQPAEGSVSDNGDGTFSFDPDGDFQDLADGETRQVSFTYQADDGNGGTDSGTVTVTVSGANDTPVANDVSYSGPTEDGTAQSFAYSGADADTTDTLTYSILTQPAEGSASDNGDGTFSFDPGSDFQDLADGETRQVSFTYQADDGNGGTDSATAQITVAGANDTPTDLDLVGTSVDEGAANGTTVGTVAVTDPDANDSFTYALLDTAGGRFAVDASGNVTVADGSLLDHEMDASHDITVEVADAASETISETFTVSVTDVNEAPTGSDASFAIDENQAASVLGSISASDPDDDGEAFGTLSYAITAGNGAGLFAIDQATGELSTTGPLDYETAASHVLSVTVSDGGGLSDQVEATVTVNDVSESGSTQTGGPGDDTLTGTPDDDTLDGAGGDDSLYGLAGSDSLLGAAGLDHLDGGDGNDNLDGGSEADVLEDTGRIRTTPLVMDGTGYVRKTGFSAFPATTITVQVAFSSDSDSVAGTPLSYASSNGANDLTLYDIRDMHVYIGDSSEWTGLSFNDGTKHDLVVTWRSDTGHLLVYDNGAQVFSTTMSPGHTLGANGALVIGQEQDSIGGGFDPDQGFEGQLDGVRVWDRVLSAQEVADLFDSQSVDGSDPLALGLVADYQFPEGSGTETENAVDGVMAEVSASGIAWAPGEGSGDMLSGGAGDDVLKGGEDDDLLLGETGNDELHGGSGSDRLDGGGGDDQLVGGSDADSYVYEVGDGDDVIYESSTTLANRHLGDTLELGSGIAPADLLVTRDAADWDDVTLGFTGISGSILIDEQFAGSGYGLEEIHFDDGTVWTSLDLAQAGYDQAASASADTIVGTPLDDTIDGQDGDDTLQGLGGADALDGGSGDDELSGGAGDDDLLGGGGLDLLDGGAGDDTLDGGDDNDVLEDTGKISTPGLSMNGSGYVRKTGFAAFPTTALTVQVQLTSDNSSLAGTPLSYGSVNTPDDFGFYDIRSLQVYVGESNVDTGLAFNDGEKHDLIATWASDTGILRVYDNGVQVYGATLNQGYAIAAGGALVLGQEQDSVAGGFDPDQGFDGVLEGVRIWDRSLSGEEVAELFDLQSIPGGDPLASGLVADYQFLEGSGTETENAVDGSLAEVSATGIAWTEGAGSSDTLSGGAGDDLLKGGADADLLQGEDGDDELHGEGGSDSLTGGAGDDRLEGGPDGDSYVYGLGDGNDEIYEVSTTSAGRHLGDELQLGAGIAPEDVIVTLDPADPDDVTLSFAGTAGSLFIDEQLGTSEYGLEEIRFDDGTVWMESTLEGQIQLGGVGDDTLTGNQYSDYLDGAGGDDDLDGGVGHDSLYGQAGSDSLEGGDGFDFLDGGDGDDVLDGGNDDDVLKDTGGIQSSSLTMDGTGYVRRNDFSGFATTAVTVQVEFSSDNTSLEGTPFSYASSNSDNDLLLYDIGDLVIYIGGGYEQTGLSFNDGEQHDLVMSWTNTTGEVVIYDNGVEVYSTTGPQGYSLGTGGSVVIGQEQDSIGGGFDSSQGFAGQMDGVRVWDRALSAQEVSDLAGIQSIGGGDPLASGLVADYQFPEGSGTETENAVDGAMAEVSASGVAWNAGGGSSDTLSGGAGDDLLEGGADDDLLYGEAGDDELYGESGNDILEGGDGDDTLNGGEGNDVLDPGMGIDQLLGGAGADTIVFRQGYGDDSAQDFSTDEDVIDVAGFGLTTLSEVLAVTTQDGADALIDLDSDDSLRLVGIDKNDLQDSNFSLVA